MVANPGFWSQLYNKGVDISLLAISTIFGATATASWFFIRHRFDLEHRADIQRQEARIAKEIEAEERLKERQRRIAQLETERDELSDRMRDSWQLSEINTVWRAYTQWLNKNRLLDVKPNGKNYEKTQANIAKLDRETVDSFPLPTTHDLADVIDATEISFSDESNH